MFTGNQTLINANNVLKEIRIYDSDKKKYSGLGNMIGKTFVEAYPTMRKRHTDILNTLTYFT